MDLDLAQTEFSLSLVQHLYQPDHNLVLSPYSLISALVMLLIGAGGNSKEVLGKALFGSLDIDKQVKRFVSVNKNNLEQNHKTLQVANLLYSSLNFPLNPKYVSTLSSQMNAIAKELDFSGTPLEALKTINSDVSQATGGLIPQLLDNISPATRLLLANAIYFNGAWLYPFSRTATNENGQFHKSNGQVVKVAMMSQKRIWDYFEDETSKCKAVQLTYRQDNVHQSGNIAMVLILPDKSVSLRKFIKSQLSAKLLHQILNNFHASSKVDLQLPRFKLNGDHRLARTLASLGIKDVLSGSANFTNISSRPIFLSEVIQKAVIEVNEEGTEAAVATAVVLLGSSRFQPKPKEFHADRPFLYLLVAKKQQNTQILFIGAVEDPTNEK